MSCSQRKQENEQKPNISDRFYHKNINYYIRNISKITCFQQTHLFSHHRYGKLI